jgi:hypothetical protein
LSPPTDGRTTYRALWSFRPVALKPAASGLVMPADQLPTHVDLPPWTPADDASVLRASEPVNTSADPASETAAASAADRTVLEMRMEQPPIGLKRGGTELPGASGGVGNLVPETCGVNGYF